MKEIENIIPLLDEENDMLLISLLRAKLKEINESKPEYSKDELRNAKNGIRKILITYQKNLRANDSFVVKINDILSRNNCEDCRFSIKKSYLHNSRWYGKETITYRGEDNTERCVRCVERCDSLRYLRREREADLYIGDPDDIIDSQQGILDCKILINKLKTKLKDYDAR